MFGSFKNARIKSEVNTLVNNILISEGGLDKKSSLTSVKDMINLVWVEYHKLVSGKIYKQPNKFSCSMLVISVAAAHAEDNFEIILLARCFESLLSELEENYGLFEFNEVDEKIIENATHMFKYTQGRLANVIHEIEQSQLQRVKQESAEHESERSNPRTKWKELSHLLTGSVGFNKQFQNCKVCSMKTGQTISENFICSKCKSEIEIFG